MSYSRTKKINFPPGPNQRSGALAPDLHGKLWLAAEIAANISLNCRPPGPWGRENGVASKPAEKSATGKVERRWLSLYVAAMGALAIFAPARRLARYAFDFTRLTQPSLRRARSCIVSRLR